MINSPDRFAQAMPAGFDGVFQWDFLKGAFGKTIMPMDFDGVVERKGNFLLFETKEPGKDVPLGQMITLEAAYKTGYFTIIYLYGKIYPESYELWSYKRKHEIRKCNSDDVKAICGRWFSWATANPKNKLDVSFLNRRVNNFDKQIVVIKSHVEEIVNSLGGTINWGIKL